MKSACYSPSDDMLSAWRPIPIAVMIPLEKVGSGWRGSQSPPPSCAEDLPTRLLARVTQATPIPRPSSAPARLQRPLQ